MLRATEGQQHEAPTSLQSQAKEVGTVWSASFCWLRGLPEINLSRDGGGGDGVVGGEP